MGLFGLFGGGKRKKDDDGPTRRVRSDSDDDDAGVPGAGEQAWREVRGEDSPFAAMEKIEQAGFPGVVAGMAKAAAGADRKVVLTDYDRELVQYVRAMTARNEW
jgi:hypothetical protein